LVVNATGFKKQSTDVSLAAETPRNLNVTLEAGGENESVTVNADEVATLQTGDASIGTTIDSKPYNACQ
jgi:hypothetical protein